MTYQVKDQTQLKASGPKQVKPNLIQYFLATVVNTSESELDLKNCYKVKFNIDGLPEFTEEYPEAKPLFDSVREVKKGDKIIVFNLSNDPAIYTFFYFPFRQERFTGIKNYNHLIDATDKDTVVIRFPGYNAIFTKNAISINADKATINITGNVTIAGNLKATHITTDAGVDVDTHVHYVGLGTTGGPAI